MKTLVVRVPDAVAAKVERRARKRGISKSDVVRESLEKLEDAKDEDPLADIRDLIGSVDDDLPADLSARVDHYLKVTGFGRDRRR